MSPGVGARIPDSFIESVLAKTDIVSLIQESVKLKKSGANFSACCPFHHEKTPSFTVSATKQFYHCFGCGKHGDAISFLMDYQSLNFVDAVERLAARLGLAVPKDPIETAKLQAKRDTTSVLNRAAEFYSLQFKNEQAKGAIAYLKKRGVTGVVAKTFGLGVAPKGWDNLLNHFKHDSEALKVLAETGMIIKHPQNHYYDRFRERIMFPIRDRRGEVIGFGARVLDNSQPKYLNSPESPIFQKGYCLYGLYEALHNKEKWQLAIVVEGYMDVVALAQMGVMGAVATLGTAITAHHLNSLFQHVSEVVFCFDGDKAGQGAAWKALTLVLAHLTESRQVRFVFLPQGDDPDSYIREHGKEAFLALVKNSMPLSEYFFATLTEQVTPDSVDNRARFASLARPLLEQMPAGIYKEMMFERLAQIAMSTPQVVRGQKAFRPFYARNGQYQKTKADPPPQPMEPAYIASALLLRQGSFYELIKDKAPLWQDIAAPGIALLNRLLGLLADHQTGETIVLKEKLQQFGFELNRLNECEKKVALIPEEGLQAEFLGVIQRLEFTVQSQKAQKLLEKAKNGELSEDEKILLKKYLVFRESI